MSNESSDNETQNRAEDAIEAFQDAEPESWLVTFDEPLNPLPVQVSRTFYLWRETDVTEVTVPAGGEARCVAVGAVFPDGQCALWWYPTGLLRTSERPRASVAVWPSIEDLMEVHLHARSRTELIWVD